MVLGVQELPGPNVPGRREPRGRCAPPTRANSQKNHEAMRRDFVGVGGIGESRRCVTYEVDAVPPVDGHQRGARLVQLPHL